MNAPLIASRRGSLQVLQLNRPERRNALDLPTLEALDAALGALPDDCRVVQLEGAGPSFCAGACLTMMRATGAAGRAANEAASRLLAAVFVRLAQLPQAVVAVAHGPVRGGGCGLLAAADVALCASDADFAFTELRLGLVPAVIAPYVMRRLGFARARALFLTAETFGAERALQVGLVDEVVAPDALAARAQAIVAALQAAGPQARRALKTLLPALEEVPASDRPQLAAETLARVRAGAEAQEGLLAFAERRAPAWREQGAP